MNQTKVDKLLLKLVENRISRTESEELLEWLEQEGNREYFNEFVAINQLVNAKRNFTNKDLLGHKIEKETRKRRYRTYFKYAAAIAGLVTATFLFRDDIIDLGKPEARSPVIVDNQIRTGTNTAVLTLEDGKDVHLDSESGFSTQNLEAKEDQVVYRPKKDGVKEVAYNFLTVPRGGQFSLTLSDGTVVWLNSESKLKYPVDFVEGKSREVHLIYGEAYFDVASSDDNHGDDFKVYHDQQEIRVLGTQFNLKAYGDEPEILTTLVEGRVSVTHGGETLEIVPGEQSRLNVGTGVVKVSEVDVLSETSWRNGIFSFKEKPLKEIMRTLSRWYDMEVVFENKALEDKKFKGVLRKSQSIEEVLSVIMSNSLDSYEINRKTVILK
ncbi:MAG: hypothetical protein CMH46_07655 [Muricauda sp.]|nr:FecR domain-containing protein [Allomuricauda sp.]MAU15399.1 hypothetical protein [Allomuricauda sp.]|tara:strand:+ start:4090 stop:5235 length:1146 start_codon:yes stop_codon:yes gene_type:complete